MPSKIPANLSFADVQVCCEAHGVNVRESRPCFLLNNVLSSVECTDILTRMAPLHDTEPDSLEPGSRSQKTLDDPALTATLLERIRHLGRGICIFLAHGSCVAGGIYRLH